MKEDLETKRAKLKSWLALHRMSRADLAERLCMSVTSINGWFSNVNIPDRKWEEIKRLFAAEEEKPEQRTISPEQLKVVATIFSPDDAERIKQVANEVGLSVEEFVRQCAIEKIRKAN
jgi:transcriptional regulator with XRE-family HTH domain